jgi:dTDP-4-dehydrorhamnose reductase
VRTLVVGSAGQLGHDLARTFGDTELLTVDRASLDITDERRVLEVVREARPDVVLNAAAWTDVDGAESAPDAAMQVNAFGPWHLARACDEVAATLVTVSTDYVFGGAAVDGVGPGGRGWREDDPVAPDNAYGRSKVAGEELVRVATDRHHIVRTAWLSGAHGSNIVRTILRLGRERPVLSFVDDQLGSPTTTADLAVGIRRLVDTGEHGTTHLTNSGTASWYDLAVAVVELAGLPARVERRRTEPGERPAARPSWSVLDGSRAEALGVGPLPYWRVALAHLLDELGELQHEGPAERRDP